MTGSDFQSASDEELARLTQAGSLVAFEALVYRYESRIYGFVAYSCRNWMDAGEITQDTFLKAYQSIGLYEARYPFATWLFTIARRKCIDYYRYNSRRLEAAQPGQTPVVPESLPELADLEDPAKLMERQEEQQQLWQAARRCLPETQFQALWLKYAEDMEVAQVAQVLRKTQTHVKVLLFRARQRLCRELAKTGPHSVLDSPHCIPHSELRTPPPPPAWPLIGQKDPL